MQTYLIGDDEVLRDVSMHSNLDRNQGNLQIRGLQDLHKGWNTTPC